MDEKELVTSVSPTVAAVPKVEPSTVKGDDDLTDWIATGADARLAIEHEHQMTIFDALRKYPKSCFWSMAISLTIIMDGYDGALLGSLAAFPSFKQNFGHYKNAKSGYQIDAQWQLALGCSSAIGNIVGIFCGAITTDRFGYKKSILLWLGLLSAFISISFFASSIAIIFAGEVLSGTSWGVFAVTAPIYASEVCPVVLRPILEVFVVMCWGFGQLLSYSVLLTLNKNTSNWGWRIPFAIQWVFPAIIIPLVLFAPESPWWLVRKGRHADAEKVIKRLTNRLSEEQVRNAVSLMIETNQIEKDCHEGVGYLDCFRGDNLWRTEITCVAWAAQLGCGFVIASYSTYFFQQAGLSSKDSYKMSVGQGGLHLLFNLISIPVVSRFGRRRLYLVGLAAMGTCMSIIGFIALAPQNKAVGFASSTIFLLWNCCYQLSVGPCAYILVSEVSSTRLRAKSVALGRISYLLCILVNYFVGPYILNPNEGNWKGKTGFLTAGVIVVLWMWSWFRLPETKGRTFAELDVLFSKGLKAREFEKYEVEIIGHGEDGKTTYSHIETK
ncbi:related to maltose permease (MalP) [Rhynchosporium agropyri]|uniref:Related to maltose permease (MalP) n=1 Tax=Rhynchosporium agropyri TaxID=914238 RepID=A0A1E1KC20_9HELO|nr:related to maltose permease (MalP) [Rhynchosporium agropyri]